MRVELEGHGGIIDDNHPAEIAVNDRQVLANISLHIGLVIQINAQLRRVLGRAKKELPYFDEMAIHPRALFAKIAGLDDG